MRIIFTCGGTGGHIYPAVAIANEIKKNHPDSEMLFVGAQGKMETELVPREGYEITTIKVTNLRRSLSFSGIKHNIESAFNLIRAQKAAKKIIKEFKPDAVVGTGGYVCFPVIRQAAKLGIFTAMHESNATPGLTTKMLEKSTDIIMLGFEESVSGYTNKSKITVTGTPVREKFFDLDKKDAKTALGIGERPLVVSFWGSLGASHMNKMTVEMMKLNSKAQAYYHIHATGGGTDGEKDMLGELKALGINDPKSLGIDVRAFIYDMPTVMAAADLVLCRAGASTLCELMSLGKPAVLIPSPFVTNDHQTKNAKVLENRGGAILIPQSECSGNKLFETTVGLLNDNSKLRKMSLAQNDQSGRTAAAEIAKIICDEAN